MFVVRLLWTVSALARLSCPESYDFARDLEKDAPDFSADGDVVVTNRRSKESCIFRCFGHAEGEFRMRRTWGQPKKAETHKDEPGGTIGMVLSCCDRDSGRRKDWHLHLQFRGILNSLRMPRQHGKFILERRQKLYQT